MRAWNWLQSEGRLRFALVLIIPIIATIVWDTFAVPNGPGRSGAAPIAAPGIIRLAIEIVVFIFAAWALYDVGFTRLRLFQLLNSPKNIEYSATLILQIAQKQLNAFP